MKSLFIQLFWHEEGKKAASDANIVY